MHLLQGKERMALIGEWLHYMYNCKGATVKSGCITLCVYVCVYVCVLPVQSASVNFNQVLVTVLTLEYHNRCCTWTNMLM